MSVEEETYVVKTTTEKQDRRYASRKFIFALAVWVGGTLGWTGGMMTTDQWIQFSKWVLGLYMAGNVGDTLVSGLAGKL